jgi:predicted esterase
MSTHDLGLVHRWLPAADVASAPTLLLLHGTGGNENDLLELGSALLPGANLLSPRGQVLENGMPRFFRRLREGVFDEEDLKARTHELAAFAEQATAQYGFNANRVVALGFSNGANIAASLLLLQPQVLRGAVLLRGMLPLQPPTPADLNGVAVLLASGEHDPLVPVENANCLAAMLRAAGADVTHLWEHSGHNLTNSDIEAAGNWLRQRFAIS